MRRILALLTGLVTAHSAPAQDWATREVCFSDPQPVTAADVVPHDLDRLEAEAAQIANSVGRLWRIESTDGAVSHLWGTMHNAHPQVLDLPEALELAIRNARLVAVDQDSALCRLHGLSRDVVVVGVGHRQWFIDTGEQGMRLEQSMVVDSPTLLR